MAVAVDAEGAAGQSDGSPTVSFTVGSGSNRALYVRVVENGNVGITGVTWNGTALTNVAQQQNAGNQTVTFWRLLNPASGTFNVVISQSSSHSIVYQITSLTGVDQTTPEGTSAAVTGNPGTGSSVNVTAGTNDLVLDALCVRSDTVTGTVGSGQTEQGNLRNADVPGVLGCFSREVGAGGTTTMSWTMSASAAFALVAVPILAAAAGGGGTSGRDLTLMGAG